MRRLVRKNRLVITKQFNPVVKTWNIKMITKHKILTVNTVNNSSVKTSQKLYKNNKLAD